MEEQLQRQNSLLKSLLEKLQQKIALDRKRLVRIRLERDRAIAREVRSTRSCVNVYCLAYTVADGEWHLAEPGEVATGGQATTGYAGARRSSRQHKS